jgi:hypothetical protein
MDVFNKKFCFLEQNQLSTCCDYPLFSFWGLTIHQVEFLKFSNYTPLIDWGYVV